MLVKNRQLHFFRKAFPKTGITITVIAAVLYGLRQVGFVASLSEKSNQATVPTLAFGIIFAVTSTIMEIMLYYGLHSDQELKEIGKKLDQSITYFIRPKQKERIDEEAALIFSDEDNDSLQQKCNKTKFLVFFFIAMLDSIGEGALAYSQSNLLEKTLISGNITFRIILAVINGLAALGATAAKEGKAAIETAAKKNR